MQKEVVRRISMKRRCRCQRSTAFDIIMDPIHKLRVNADKKKNINPMSDPLESITITAQLPETASILTN